METLGISATLVVTGLLPLVLLAAALLSLPACFFLLRLYRRAAVAGMDTAAGATAPALPQEPPSRPPAIALCVVDVDATVPASDDVGTAAARRLAARGLWRAAAVYAFAGIVYAGLMTVGNVLADPKLHGSWIQMAFLVWNYLWPAVLVVLLVAAYDRKRRAQVLGVYAAVFIAIVQVATARNPEIGALTLVRSWVLLNGPATILVFTFTLRPIRAVGPIVLTLLLILAAGTQSLVLLASASAAVLRAVAGIASSFGLNARGVFFALIMSGMLVSAPLGWLMLRRIGRRYEARKFSDQAIVVDALFLMFCVVQSVGLVSSSSRPLWLLTGGVAFAGYKTCALLAFRLVRASACPPRNLLLLRVFRLGPRSQRLFNKLRRHWLPVGCISMIAGPDLVTTTVEPHEFLEFLGGKLRRRFVTGAADLEQRMASLDPGADPDGRHRIDEFFCRADTWQMSMQRLAAASDAVLMDLRSFSPASQGCVYELGQLLDGVDLDRVVFLVDKTTDRTFLQARLQGAWHQLSSRSPNRNRPLPVARLFQITDEREAALVALCAHLVAQTRGAAAA